MAVRRSLHVCALIAAATVFAPEVRADTATCVAPADPGGGFDLTCRLVAEALSPETDVTRTFQPGGVGAVAFNAVVEGGAAPGTLVAFSEGSIYNLALGHYGRHDLGNVRWLAGIAQDHGVVVVAEDAPWQDLRSLLDAVAADPQRVAIGGGGTIPGQDWMRAAMTARLAGIGPDALRFVALEGGGNCTRALIAGFVAACMNDVGDTQAAIEAGQPLRILAVMAPQRLSGPLSDIPTAREQGIPLDWPVLRGLYMAPGTDEAEFRSWQQRMEVLTASPEWAALMARHHLTPLSLTGPALEARLTDLAAEARSRAAELGVP